MFLGLDCVGTGFVSHSLALGPVAGTDPVELPVCAGFGCGTLRFIAIGLTDEQRLPK